MDFFSQCNIANICTVKHDYGGQAQNELSDFIPHNFKCIVQ